MDNKLNQIYDQIIDAVGEEIKNHILDIISHNIRKQLTKYVIDQVYYNVWENVDAISNKSSIGEYRG